MAMSGISSIGHLGLGSLPRESSKDVSLQKAKDPQQVSQSNLSKSSFQKALAESKSRPKDQASNDQNSNYRSSGYSLKDSPSDKRETQFEREETHRSNEQSDSNDKVSSRSQANATGQTNSKNQTSSTGQVESKSLSRTSQKTPVTQSELADYQISDGGTQDQLIAERNIQGAPENVVNKIDPLAQRAAMKKFILKMQDELNVDPVELIQAFSKMPAEDLMKPPEKSVDTFVNELGLSEADTQKAKKYFLEMLQQAANSSMADYIKNNNQDLSIAVLSKDQLRKQEMQSSIDKMNNTFFSQKPMNANDPNLSKAKNALRMEMAKAAYGKQGLESQYAKRGVDSFYETQGADNQIDVNYQNQSNGENASPLSGKNILEGAGLESARQASKASQSELAADSFKNLNNLSSQSNSGQFDVANLSNSQNISREALQSAMNNLKAQNSNAMNGEKEVTSDSTKSLAKGSGSTSLISGGESQSSLFTKGLSQGEKSLADHSESGGDQSSEFFASGGIAAAEHKKHDADVSNEFVVNKNPEMSKNDEASNIKELVNQARLMIKSGGGEMKVHMSPNGLGAVTLKVNVENGRVNVDMVTDNHDVKKLIEHGLGDLKATLASHNLNVDKIKVDVGQQQMNDLAQQHQEAERQFAQQFMGDFQRNNSAFRDNFFDVPGPHRLASQTDDSAENLMLKAQSARRARAQSEGRLDLIA